MQPPPEVPSDAVLYRTDGACRGQGSADDVTHCAFAAVRWEAGAIVGRHAVLLGNVTTNNTAEYSGVLSALQDAARRRAQHAIFHTDSLLIARQLNGLWRCKAAELIPYYEKSLLLLKQLRDSGSIIDVLHIYREFNGEADGLANSILDGMPQVRDSWFI